MKRILVVAVFLVAWLLLSGTFYVVGEPEQIIITQFGEPIGDPVDTPGLKVKVPFIQRVHRFDKRFLEWDGDANELPTKDKRFVYVDVYARWHITDPLLFFQRLRDERGAQTRLDDILDGETRNAVANHDLVEIVRNSNRQPDATLIGTEEIVTLAEISTGREEIQKIILEKSKERVTDLGIDILDVRFKRINYVEEVRRKVYDRMIAERRRIADRYRSEGEGEAARIRGERDRDLDRIQSEAYRQAQTIIGQADAEATRIFAAAYDQSAESRSFYEFIRTMESYRQTIDETTSLMLSTDGDFTRFLERIER